jgi:hypothetical protein
MIREISDVTRKFIMSKSEKELEEMRDELEAVKTLYHKLRDIFIGDEL